MRTFQRLIYLSVLFQFLFTTAYSANRYVDKNANGSNSGSSWTNAWESFSAINWGSVNPGDVIYISGGVDSTVYYERLVIGKSGTAGNYITIRNSYSAGHNGRVVIADPGPASFDGCIYMSAIDYVYIKGIETRGGIRACYLYTQCDYVTIDSCIFKNWYPNGNTGGLKVEGQDAFPHYLNCSNIEIKNCIVESSFNWPQSTDCVYIQGALNTKIHDNFIHQRNASTVNSHVDCIQMYRTAGVKIWNNVCIVDPGVQGHGMILGVESRANYQDTMIVYNNYFYAGGHELGGDPDINAGYNRWYGQNYHPLSYWIHNTIVTQNSNESPVVMEYMGFFKNNIIVQFGTNGQPPTWPLPTINAATCASCNPPFYVDSCTNNLIWREWGDVHFYGQFSGNGYTGTPSGWSSWVNTYGGTGVNSNPLFVNNVRERNGYVISSNSPARNTGGDLQAFIESKGLPWTDIDGNLRDNTPDIGAYQYSGGGGTTFSLSVNIINGWNVVSVPGINPNGMDIDTWWADRNNSSNVFKFDYNYFPVTTTTPGEGYWMKHSGANIYNTGNEWPAGGIQIVPHNPINATTGWNLIGGYENSASTAAITTNPPGLIGGPIYKFSGIYQVATTINPGYGYWIKLTGSGQLILPGTLSKENETTDWFPKDWGRIVLTDATGINYTLYAVKGEVDLNQYELPPAPPEGMFDIRFSTGRIAEYLNSAIKSIEISGVTYPLTVRVENMDIRLQDETGRQISTNLKSGENVVISDGTIDKLLVSSELKPTKYTLEQNYPNPFNPSTVIEFSLPEDVSNVKLSIYNALGEKVAELVNTVLTAGKYQYQWNAENVATGIYIYELRTDNFVSVKKMLLMK